MYRIHLFGLLRSNRLSIMKRRVALPRGPEAVETKHRTAQADVPATPGRAGQTVSAKAGQHEADRSFPVVGIGASAGGLEALTQLLDHLPADTGLAFVLIQHLAAHRESLLPELLARKTPMQVLAAEDGSVLVPNSIFVLPADKDITISKGVLSLSARPETSRPHHPVDHFLRSLAADRKDRAVAVILSGALADGSLGVQAVKEEGGIVFAQSLESAQHPGMPQSAIATGCVDVVLPPEGIARELTRIGRHPQFGGPDLEGPAAPPPARRRPSRDDFCPVAEKVRDGLQPVSLRHNRAAAAAPDDAGGARNGSGLCGTLGREQG
jgi:chemotaxis response regulator CheB